MKKLLYFACAVFSLSALAVSCEKNPIDEPADGPQVRTFTCVIADNPDSKLAIDGTGKSTWEVGDEISIHGGTDGHDRAVVTLTAADISADGKTATISFEMDPYTRTDAGVVSQYYAEYPASAVPSGNLYYECRFNKTNEILMAACDVDDTFVFYNLCSVISFSVSGDFDKYVFAGKNGETVGYNVYQARIRNDNSGMVVNYWKTGNGSGTPSPLTQLEKAVNCDGTTLNYICIPSSSSTPNCVSFSSGFVISFIKDGNIVKTASVKNNFSLAVGDYLPLGNITSHLKDYVAPTEHDSAIDLTNATDLSASASANCYIVNANDSANQDKVFKFKAVKGNGNVSVGSVESVTILWETYNNAESVTAKSVISQVDYDLHDDECYIVFKMPSTLHAGNAVIAAKNGADEILWSWHIWVPNSAVATVDASNICGATLMDRNLGALEPVSTASGASTYSLGMVYQWGRKDPFPGPKRVEKDAGHATVAGTAPTMSTSSMTTDELIQHPTVYAAANSSASLTLWGRTKTINDPCPPGYKMPYGSRGSKPMWNTSNIVTALTDAGLGWEVNTSGYWFKMSDGDNELVFPIAGYVEEGGSTYYSYKNTLRAAIWFLCDSSSSSYHLNIRPNESTPVYQFGSTSTARGCNVRCCVE